jgi:hypothetical protein
MGLNNVRIADTRHGQANVEMAESLLLNILIGLKFKEDEEFVESPIMNVALAAPRELPRRAFSDFRPDGQLGKKD